MAADKKGLLDSLADPLTRESTLGEWFADPVGRALLEAKVAEGHPPEFLQVLDVLASMPMSTLANFVGVGLDHDTLDAAAAAWRAHTPLPAASTATRSDGLPADPAPTFGH